MLCIKLMYHSKFYFWCISIVYSIICNIDAINIIYAEIAIEQQNLDLPFEIILEKLIYKSNDLSLIANRSEDIHEKNENTKIKYYNYELERGGDISPQSFVDLQAPYKFYGLPPKIIRSLAREMSRRPKTNPNRPPTATKSRTLTDPRVVTSRVAVKRAGAKRQTVAAPVAPVKTRRPTKGADRLKIRGKATPPTRAATT